MNKEQRLAVIKRAHRAVKEGERLLAPKDDAENLGTAERAHKALDAAFASAGDLASMSSTGLVAHARKLAKEKK